MITIFDGTYTTAGLVVDQFHNNAQLSTNLPTTFAIADDTIAVLNIYNLSPHWVYFSISSGIPDLFLPPSYCLEGVSLERLTGMKALSVGGNKGFIQNIKLTRIGFVASQQSNIGNLIIQGFRVDENWQGSRPLIAGSLAPFIGGSVASQLINTGSGPGAVNVIDIANTSGFGSIIFFNDGTGAITVLDNGNNSTVLSITKGSNITPAALQFGTVGENIAGFYGSHYGAVILSESVSIPTLVNGSTIAIQATGTVGTILGSSRVSSAAAVTGLIMATTINGVQVAGGAIVIVDNTTGFSLTFAASATSHVSTGAECFIPGHTATLFVFDDSIAQWVPVVSSFNPTPSATSPAVGTGGTISTFSVSVARVTPAAAVTGVILAVGAFGGQQIIVENQGVAASTITMAAAGTSNCAAGTSVVIAGLTSRLFVWDTTAALWY